MKKTTVVLLLFFMVGLSLVGTVEQANAQTQPKTFNIGFCAANFQTPFQVSIMNSAKAEAEKYGIKVDAQDGKDDPVTQVSIIQNFITQKKDLIILVPTQQDALVPVVKQANAAKIPVIIVNRALGDGADYVTEVNMDAYEGGRIAAELADDLLDGEGNVAMLLGILGSGPQVLESKGFKDYIAEHAPGIKIVAEQNSDWDKAKAIAATENLLTRFGPGQLDAIVCQGPDDAAGAIQVIKAKGRTELLGKVIGFDFPQESLELIREGSLYGTVLQDPDDQGKLAIQVAYEYLTNPSAQIEKQTYQTLYKVNPSNVEEFKHRTAW